MASSALNDLAVPLIRAVNLSPFVSQLGQPAPGGVTPLQDCQSLDCTSGSGIYCPIEGGFTVTFTACQIPGTSLTGDVSITGNAAAGSGTITLTIGQSTVEGAVSYTVEGNCLNQSFSDVAVTTPRFSGTLNGYMAFCSPPVTLNGVIIPDYSNFVISVPDPARLIVMSTYSDPVGGYEVTISEADNTPELVLVCTGVLFGSASCFDPRVE